MCRAAATPPGPSLSPKTETKHHDCREVSARAGAHQTAGWLWSPNTVGSSLAQPKTLTQEIETRVTLRISQTERLWEMQAVQVLYVRLHSRKRTTKNKHQY